MSELDILFYVLAFNTLFFGSLVVLSKNPLFSSLHLVLSMLSVAGLFMTLNATFIAAVQIIVYAGAVLVLFVIVLMLFDLKHEYKAFTKGKLSGFFKLASAGVLGGVIAAAVLVSSYKTAPPEAGSASPDVSALAQEPAETKSAEQEQDELAETREISTLLFTKYLLAFEIMGLLLLVVPVGVVTLSRSAGGTHAKH